MVWLSLTKLRCVCRLQVMPVSAFCALWLVRFIVSVCNDWPQWWAITNDGIGFPTNIDYSINHFIVPYLFELNSTIDRVTISFVYSQAAKRCMLDKGLLNYSFYPRIIAQWNLLPKETGYYKIEISGIYWHLVLCAYYIPICAISIVFNAFFIFHFFF